MLAGVYFKASTPQNLTSFAGGTIEFDARASAPGTALTFKVDCVHPCSSGDWQLPTTIGTSWQRISIAVDDLVARSLDLSRVDTGLVIWPSALGAVTITLDNLVWQSSATSTPDPEPTPTGTGGPTLMLDNLSGQGNVSPTSYAGYQLTWSDEFNQQTLDTATWNFDVGGGGWGNNELQYYQQDNVAIDRGHLVITAKEENRGGRSFTSSRIKTEGTMEFGFGRVDIRAALPRGQGIWPALWALGADFQQVGWPYCGELDIMEMIGGGGRENTVHGTLHWNVGGIGQPYAPAYQGGAFEKAGDDFGDGFNVFSMVREHDRVQWLVNDALYHEQYLPDSIDFKPFDNPFFLIFNIAVGGNWPGSPDASTQFPQRMVVDYVRVFSANNENEDSDGDGIPDSDDAFPLDPNESLDTDGDGVGDNADSDDDGDGVPDYSDAFPTNPEETLDTDGDGVGNNADSDDDGDGVPDYGDAFPTNPGESLDTDGDGVGNNADSDDDGDGVPDYSDAFPTNPGESLDTDGDGVGNNADSDDDGDGYDDTDDLFPLDASEWSDTDGDGIGDNADEPYDTSPVAFIFNRLLTAVSTDRVGVSTDKTELAPQGKAPDGEIKKANN
jgi:beta-glucanase (GH16 family)